MSRLQVPPHLVEPVRRFADDFARVTAAWVRAGWHGADEVATWREVIRRDMASEQGADPAVDPRPREERITAWCRTFAGIARREGL